MKRDLVFFVAGLGFGIAAGYSVFRAVLPEGDAPAAVSEAVRPSAAASPIGLDETPQPEVSAMSQEVKELDEAELERLLAEAKTRPDDPALATRIAELYFDAGRFQEASEWFAKVLERDADDSRAWSRLALAYLNLGRLDDATATYERALKRHPDDPASLLGLGRIRLYVQKDIEGGLALWERLMSVAPGSPEAQGVRDELEALKSAHSGS